MESGLPKHVLDMYTLPLGRTSITILLRGDWSDIRHPLRYVFSSWLSSVGEGFAQKVGGIDRVIVDMVVLGNEVAIFRPHLRDIAQVSALPALAGNQNNFPYMN